MNVVYKQIRLTVSSYITQKWKQNYFALVLQTDADLAFSKIIYDKI